MNYLEFCEGYECISIPKIQREYVQGTNDKGTVFLNDIFSAINSSKNKSLDLVFGSVRNDAFGKKVFEPIDGQQRLTTLFLLYLYVSKVENRTEADDQLKKFTYETRSSSGKFCSFLCDLSFGEEIPSEYIKNHKAYYDDYNYDYTVKSMIQMLDRIHDVYNSSLNVKKGNVFDLLNNYLQFAVCKLDDYKLGDDLYLIMNDRGKPLSAIENLKSAIIAWMRENVNSEICKFFNEEVEDGGAKIPRYLVFSSHMDNVWSENIWRRVDENSKLIDSSMQRADTVLYTLFGRFFWNEAIKYGKNDVSDEIKDFFYSSKETEFVFANFKTVFDQLKDINDVKDFYERLIKFMDFITSASGISEVEEFVSCPFETNSNDTVDGDSDDSAIESNDAAEDNEEDSNDSDEEEENEIRSVTYNQFLGIDYSDKFKFGLNEHFLFWGLQMFVENTKETDSEKRKKAFRDWKRFIWNILSVGYVQNSKSTTISHIKNIRELREINVDDIYGYLSSIDYNAKTLDAIKYEIRKAKYLNCNKDIYNEFAELEKHSFLKGDIDWFVEDPKLDTKAEFDIRKNNCKYIFGENGLNSKNHLALLNIVAKTTIVDNEKPIHYFETDGDRMGLLKTQLHITSWDKAIRDLLKDSNLEQMMKENLNDVDKTSDYPGNSERAYWHEILCNKDFYNECMKVQEDKKSKRPIRIEAKNSELSVLIGTGRIVCNSNVQTYAVKGLDMLHNFLKSYNEIKLPDKERIVVFQYSNFSVSVLDTSYYLEIDCKNGNATFALKEKTNTNKLIPVTINGKISTEITNDAKVEEWCDSVVEKINSKLNKKS